MKNNKTNNRVRVDYKQLIQYLKHLGYYETRKNRSDHRIYKNADNRTTVVPDAKGTVPIGTLSAILKQVGSSRQELADFLNE